MLIRGPSRRYYFEWWRERWGTQSTGGIFGCFRNDEVVEITIAVDSDGILGLFGGDAQAAVDHIAAIFNFAGPTWENELQLSVVVGDIFLHSMSRFQP